MNVKYSQIYRRLLFYYAYPIPRLRRFRGRRYLYPQIIESIDSAEYGYLLRSDAKYFLLVNFDHMVIRPILENRQSKYDEIQLAIDIQEDIHQIVSHARDRMAGEDISAHAIMSSIDTIWRELRTTKLEIWG